MAGRHFREATVWVDRGSGAHQSCIYSIYSQALGGSGRCRGSLRGWLGWQQPPRVWGAWAEAGLMGGTWVPSSSACPALGPWASLSAAVRGWSLGRGAGGEAGALVHHRAGKGGPFARQWSFWLTGPSSQALSPWPRGRCRRSQAGWVGEVGRWTAGASTLGQLSE